MYNNKTFLGIIPARSGSKRLPNKNILELGGKPLIFWSIDAGKNSKYIDEIMVNTDSYQIAEIAKKYGARVPFIRPNELSTDKSSVNDVIKHTIYFYKNILKREFDYIVLLQPTSPFRKSNDIDRAVELLKHKRADAIISVCKMEHNPLWSNTLPKNLSMKNFINHKIENKRSQNLKKYYRLNGAIYICKIKRFLKENSLFLKNNIYGYIMEEKKSIDIDTEYDLMFLRFIFSKKLF